MVALAHSGSGLMGDPGFRRTPEMNHARAQRDRCVSSGRDGCRGWFYRLVRPVLGSIFRLPHHYTVYPASGLACALPHPSPFTHFWKVL